MIMTHGAIAAWIAQAQPAGPALWSNLALMGVLFAIFWFVLIRPMRKRQKEHEDMLEKIQRGDKVVTNGGLYGEVAALDKTTIHLKIADNVRVKVAKSAIAGLQGETDGGAS